MPSDLYSSTVDPSARKAAAGLEVMAASQRPGRGLSTGESRLRHGPSGVAAVATRTRFEFHAVSYRLRSNGARARESESSQAHPPLVRGSTRRCGIRAVGEGLTTAGRRVVVRGANVEEHVLAPLSMPVHRGVVRALAVPKARAAPRQRHTAHPPRTQWAACHGVSHLGIRHPRIVAKLLGPSREEHVIQPVAAEDDRRPPRHPARQPEAAACDCL